MISSSRVPKIVRHETAKGRSTRASGSRKLASPNTRNEGGRPAEADGTGVPRSRGAPPIGTDGTGGLDRSVCEKVPAAEGRKLIYGSKGGEAVQSNATPIRFSLRQTMWQGMRTPSALKTRLKRSGRPMGLVTSSAAPPIDMFRMTQLIASPPNSIVPAINTRFRWVARLSTESSIDRFSEQSVNADLISFRFAVTGLRIGARVLRTCTGFPLVAPGVRSVERPFPMAGLYSSAGIRDSDNTSVIWNPGANSPRAGAVFV